MRILFTFVGGHGHFEPMAPLARAARAAGHEVAFACPPAMAATVRAAGLAALPVGRDAGGPPRRLPLRAPDPVREARELRERFAERAARARLPRVAELCARLRPAALVCDETDFGGALAAERAALPFATVAVTATGSFVRAEVVAGALDALRAEHGLAPDPRLEAPARHAVLAPFPPTLRDPASPPPATLRRYRPWTRRASAGPAPAWAGAWPGAPTLLLTLGTVFNVESGDLLTRLLAALRALPANVLVVTGPAVDPDELGSQPDHVRVERFVPWPAVLPWCDAVVSHAGSGSVMGALTWGLPSVLVPLGADQPHNAARCAALGVAEVLDPLAADPEAVRAAVERVLGEPAYRTRAARVRDEIAALPAPADAVRVVEEIARETPPPA